MKSVWVQAGAAVAAAVASAAYGTFVGNASAPSPPAASASAAPAPRRPAEDRDRDRDRARVVSARVAMSVACRECDEKKGRCTGGITARRGEDAGDGRDAYQVAKDECALDAFLCRQQAGCPER